MARAHAPDLQARDHPHAKWKHPVAAGLFDAFVKEFNTERPNEALALQWPGERYRPSRKAHQACRSWPTRSTTRSFQ